MPSGRDMGDRIWDMGDQGLGQEGEREFLLLRHSEAAAEESASPPATTPNTQYPVLRRSVVRGLWSV